MNAITSGRQKNVRKEGRGWSSVGHSHIKEAEEEDFFFLLFRGAPVAYVSSQARGQIGATVAGLC